MQLKQNENLINIVQGDYAIGDNSNVVLTTVLGSCVAVCLCDVVAGIGGMNHFLLPYRDGKAGKSFRYGAFSMELLINGLLKKGARKERLIAKVFGGACMNTTLRDIGASNVAFTRDFLQNEAIKLVSESVGGNSARRIRFWPYSGIAKQFLVPGEAEPEAVSKHTKITDDITIFYE